LKVKRGVHLTNYGGSAPTAADAMGCSLAEAIEFQRKWFDIHPAIVGWHMKVRNTLQRNRTMVTKWGRKVTYHGRCDDNMWRDALAFVPQSTVADTINRGLINVYENMKGRVRVKSQIHDSLLLQVKDCEYKEDIIKEIERNMLIPIPYTEPLIIPVEAKMSYKSWGDCEKIQVI
jgi:DNA polymerase I-like protein with 3'-5' exonuclease and polymerase domains